MAIGHYTASASNGHRPAHFVAQATAQLSALATRAERGMNLLADGYHIDGALARKDNVVYFVTNPQGKMYVVWYAPERHVVSCTCPDFKTRRVPCKHLAGVMYHKASVDAETAILRADLAARRAA